jgi:ribosome biogenesis GTPase
MTGQILSGINNIYTVSADGRQLLCRIKGKVLQEDILAESLPREGVFSDRRLKRSLKAYNPLAVGDWVEISPDPHDPQKGWIETIHRRKSFLVRFNKKKSSLQIIASNVDVLVCISSAKNPPFRPRFIDRMLISAELGGVEPIVFVNKSDLGLEPEDRRRLRRLKGAGYPVLVGSALRGRGLGRLKRRLKGKTAVFVGHSGVGKSCLLNRMDGSLDLKVGEISQKHDRGGHITNYAVLLDLGFGARIIDTPGIRELDVYGISPEELSFHFPEFKKPALLCEYSTCCHMDEPGCGVKAAVERGKIHEDRYVSYQNIFLQLKDFQQYLVGRDAWYE